MYWLVSALALLGVWLNIKKHPVCFVIWTFTNAVWATVDWLHGLHAQAALMAVYCALALYGIQQWTRGEKGDTRETDST